MAFLQWLMPGLSSPLPLPGAPLSSPPFLTLLSTSLDAGLSSTELITCCAVECVRGGAARRSSFCDSALR